MSIRTSAPLGANSRTTRGRALRLAVAAAGSVGAVLAGGALGASPAMAAATASVCDYNTANKNVIVTDNSGGAELSLLRRGEELMVADGAADPRFCFVVGGPTATVKNTEKITVFAAPAHVAGGYRIDQNNGRFAPGATPETDGDSEIEITLVTSGVSAPRLTVAGTPQNDVISVGTGGRINFAYDNDADVIPQTKPAKVRVTGGVGNDEIDGLGGSIFSPPADLPIDLSGDADSDTLFAGGNDNILRGGFGDDRLFSANGISFDGLTGGPGFDVAETDKFENIPFGDIEQIKVIEKVGRLTLAPAVVDTRAGTPAHMKLSWTHPKAWKQLRTITLRLGDGADTVGRVTITPGSGRLRGHGAVKLIARGSRLSHRGRTVTADLALRLPHSLAGKSLRLDVEATDHDGNRQVERLAGHIRLAK